MVLVDVQQHPEITGFPKRSIEDHISFMNSFGCDVAVISNQPPQPTERNRSLFHRMNDDLIGMEKASQNRLIACPSIPIDDAKAALDELERVTAKFDMRTIVIRPINGRIDYRELDTFYEKVTELNLLVLVHPIFSDSGYGALFARNELLLGSAIGFMVDSTIAIARLIFGGLLERFKKLKLVFHHLGGAAPFLLGRLEAVYDESKADLPWRPTDYFKMLYLDTVCYDQEPLDFTCRIVGPDHLLFGSDFGCPTKGLVRTNQSLRAIDRLSISDGDKLKILGGNALRLLGKPELAQKGELVVSTSKRT